ncbi:MAG: polysaccharide biosynthesis protein, partial [Clostridia bacterium]|nr:polysaccharide biosynthesis protein [Clostridia bacterium]
MVKEKAHGVKKEKGLLSGVLLLTLAGVLVKILGFVYKVPLNALLGDEMANVNAAYAIYALLYTAATAGVPGAISLSVSRAVALGDKRRVKLILYSTLGFFLALGLLLFLVMAMLAKPLAQMNSGGDSYGCILASSPALFFTALSCVLRGYFQGFSDMKPTAVSQLLEALGKAAIGLLLVYFALYKWGKTHATAAALGVFGITLGVALSAVYLLLALPRRGRLLLHGVTEKTKTEEKGSAVFRSVIAVALPITLTSAMMSLSTLMDAQMMRPLLGRYYGDEALAKAIYSDYSTGAVTLYNLPAIFIAPLCTVLVPYVSSALAKGEKRGACFAMESALSAAALLSLPCALGMSALSGPLLTFVFRGDEDMAEHAGILLSVLALSVFFLALLMVTASALQAIGKERLPILSLGAGLLVKLVSMPPLIMWLGKVGAPLST